MILMLVVEEMSAERLELVFGSVRLMDSVVGMILVGGGMVLVVGR